MTRLKVGACVGLLLLAGAPLVLAHEGRRGPEGGFGGPSHHGDRGPPGLPCYLASFDADGDGMLNEEERAAAQAKIDEVKAKYDADADGHLSCEERSAAITELCPDVEAPSCDREPHPGFGLPCFLQAFDADGDGALSDEERAAAQAKLDELRAGADADNDGVVTCSEIRAALESLCADEDSDDDTVQLALVALGGSVEASFIRGDTDGNAAVDVSDAVGMLRFLFQGASAPACLDAVDANDDGSLDLADATTLLGVLFLGASRLAEPYPSTGFDGTADDFTCVDG
jgi:Ca2+-binding EF-hand superfamily protein